MKKEVKIGIIGIVALGLLFFGINYLKGVSILKPCIRQRIQGRHRQRY